MATGYSQKQLDLMEDTLEAVSPPMPTKADRKRAFTVTAMRGAGTEIGVLVNLGLRNGKKLFVMLNCVVAKELMVPLTAASMANGWHTRDFTASPSDHLQYPRPDHLAAAQHVTGLSTYGMQDGVFISIFMPDEDMDGEIETLFFPARIAVELALFIGRAGDSAQWWTPEFDLIPSRKSQN